MPTHCVEKMERYYQIIQKETYMNDEFSKTAVNRAVLEEIIRTVKHELSLELELFELQKTVPVYLGRSVCCDFYGMDTDHIHYIVELQNDDEGTAEERLRYIGSILDTSLSEPSDKWKEFQHLYIIMITRNDVLKRGRPIYHIEPTIIELGEKARMKITYVYVPIEGNTEGELGQLMRDLCEADPYKIINPILRERMIYLKKKKEGLVEMSEGLKEIVDEIVKANFAEYETRGKEQGKIEGKKEGGFEKTIELIKNLMSINNLAARVAMRMLGIPANEQEEYMPYLTAV